MLMLAIKSYLIGSIPFAYIFAKAWKKTDIRKVGSENVGTTNVLKQIGVVPGLLTALFDASKGIGAVMLGRTIVSGVNGGEFIALLLAMIGHIWPVWLKFCGGGGLATFIGGMLLVSKWWVIIILLGIWGILYKIMKSHDRSALVTCYISPVLLGIIHSSWNYFLFGISAATIVGSKRLVSIKKNKHLPERNNSISNTTYRSI